MANGNNDFGPNYLGYYRSLLCNLFSKGEDGRLLFVEAGVDSQAEACPFRGKGEGNFNVKNNRNTTCVPPVSFFNKAVGEELSEYKKERLKAIIHESAVSLNHEANEILGEILAKLRSESNKHNIASVGSYSCSMDDGMREHTLSKKRKSADYSNLGSTFGIHNSQIIKQASNDDIQAIQGDTLSCQEGKDQCTNKILEKVSKLGEDVEELLNVVVSQCRPMTDAEKKQLGRRIQNLPPDALAHVAETFYTKCSSQAGPDEISCNLKSLDNVTLWRLYYYTMCKRSWRLPTSKTV